MLETATQLGLQNHEFRVANPNVLYLSGMPASGKTTITSALCQKLNCELIPEFYEPVPKWVINTRKDHPLKQRISAQLWSLNQHINKNRRISSLSGTVVVDRTWIDSLIYAYPYGQEVSDQVLKEVRKHEWLPGSYVALIAEPKTVKDRLCSRLKLTQTQWEKDWEVFINEIYNATQIVASRFFIPIIDTSNISPEEAVKTIAKMI